MTIFSPASPALTLLFYNWDVNLLKLPTNRKWIWLDWRYSQSAHPPFLHRGICPLHHITNTQRCASTGAYQQQSTCPLKIALTPCNTSAVLLNHASHEEPCAPKPWMVCETCKHSSLLSRRMEALIETEEAGGGGRNSTCRRKFTRLTRYSLDCDSCG